MILVVSHYTRNKGVTDFFLDHLESIGLPYMYLKHPLYFENIKFSELIYFDGFKCSVLLKIRKVNNLILSLIEDFVISIFISIKLGKRIDKVISFGGFNFFPFIFFDLFLKRKLYFWGVDYSTKRFDNKILNKLYFYFETISCKFSTLVIQTNIRQQTARINRHGLDINKSLILPNGVNFVSSDRNILINEIALIYIGSITKQHGIIDFVKFFYGNKKINYKLYIFGGGECENELKAIINSNPFFNTIMYFGEKNQYEINEFIKNCGYRLFGVAPYSEKYNDHVYFGDSIKVKEYLSHNIPFITSRVTYLAPDIEQFGFVYDNFEELNIFFGEPIGEFRFDEKHKNTILKRYLWCNILSKLNQYLN